MPRQPDKTHHEMEGIFHDPFVVCVHSSCLSINLRLSRSPPGKMSRSISNMAKLKWEFDVSNRTPGTACILGVNHRRLCQLQIDHQIEPPFDLEKRCSLAPRQYFPKFRDVLEP